MPTTHYDVLGIPPTASADEVREAHRLKALACHPDRGGSHEAMIAVNAAFETLGDPVKRADYDTLLSARRQRTRMARSGETEKRTTRTVPVAKRIDPIPTEVTSPSVDPIDVKLAAATRQLALIFGAVAGVIVLLSIGMFAIVASRQQTTPAGPSAIPGQPRPPLEFTPPNEVNDANRLPDIPRTLPQGDGSSTKPVWLYAHDVRVRSGGQKDIEPETPKVGMEFFNDRMGGAILGITQNGNLTVYPAGPLHPDKRASWLFAHDLVARKVAEPTFTRTTTRFGVEAFRDGPSGCLLYVSQKSSVAIVNMPGRVLQDNDPIWHHGLILAVRGPDEREFTRGTKRFGVEVYKDGNTGGLIYVTEFGMIAASMNAPQTPPDPDKIKSPKPLYGMSLRVRGAGEAEFSDDTRRIGVEVFRDENTGKLVYISDAGSLDVVPSPVTVLSGRGATWQHGMKLMARPGGEADFEKASRFGIETFRDHNTGYLVYINNVGSLAVLVPK